MIRLFAIPASQNPPASGQTDERDMSDVVVWIQEHTNLCMVIARTGVTDSETQQKLREKLLASADRGKQLVSALLVSKGDLPAVLSKLQEATQTLAPVAGSARARAAIPLSGSGLKRFEDPASSRSPLRPVPSMGVGTTPAGHLVPSRTYIKKSGT